MKWKVDIDSVTTVRATITIDAESEVEAKRKANEIIDSGGSLPWRSMTSDEIEITRIMEAPNG